MIFELRHRLIFLRHGETDWNAEGRLQGGQDIPLNAKGLAQAEAAGRIVGKIVGRDKARLEAFDYVASPLGRARRTMELARGALALDPFAYRIEERLRELSFGRWEGMTWPEVQVDDPGAAARREADKWSLVPPGGESYAMLCDRLRPWLETIDCDTIAVAHGGVARCLMYLLAGTATERAPMSDIWQGRVLVFEAGRYRWI
ncbi:MAG: histidine phosphatase family protein [Hyphomicrobiales bacterium]|nr:histidine phosphatase family protein [Hyphomicrobiales bacterium]